MGWDLNKIFSEIKEILGDRFISYYATLDSTSSIRIFFVDSLAIEEEEKIVGLFPDLIRVEFELSK